MKKTFLNHLTDTLEHQTILDLAEHGVDGGYPGLTYTADCVLLWAEYQDEILEALINDSEDLGYSDPGAFISTFRCSHMMDTVDGLKNLLVWYMAEREALRYADACENDEEVVR